MADSIENRLKDRGISLPQPAAPAASYVSVMQSGNLLFTAGQLPIKDGKLAVTGLVGKDLDVAQAKQAAELCAINILAQVKAATGDLDKVARIVKLTCFVASAPGFSEQHLVANGASDFLGEIMGEKGKHARSAVGVAMLPLNAAVEIEAIVELA